MQSLNSDCLPALGLRPPFCILKPKPLDYWDVCWVQLLSCVWFFRIPRSIAHQTPLSMGFVWQEYWSGLPFPPPGDLPHPGVKLVSLALEGGFFTTESLGKPGYWDSTSITILFKKYIYIYYFWLHWVFIVARRGLSLVEVGRLLLLQSTGSRARELQYLWKVGSVVVAWAGLVLDQGSNPHPLF